MIRQLKAQIDSIYFDGSVESMLQSDEGTEMANNTSTIQPPAGYVDEGQRKISPAPNGGIMAWMQVLGAFMLFFNSW